MEPRQYVGLALLLLGLWLAVGFFRSIAAKPSRSGPGRSPDLPRPRTPAQTAFKTHSRAEVDAFQKTVETVSRMQTENQDEALMRLKPVSLPGTDRGCFVEVVGESFRLDVLRDALDSSEGREASFFLFPEIANEADLNAVAVMTDERKLIGYLTREDAPRYRQTLFELRARGEIGRAFGRFVGGTEEKPNIGVWLDVVPPTVLAKHFGIKYTPVRD
jgi:hypothetical protein